MHYAELLEFLQLLTTKPRLFVDRELVVISSEPLYSEKSKLNHRLKKNYIPVHNKLYEQDPSEYILQMVVLANEAMCAKLQSYKKDHFPGGKYHDPDPETQSVLSNLKDLKRAFRVQTGNEILMTSRKVMNIVINSECEANADLLCGSS